MDKYDIMVAVYGSLYEGDPVTMTPTSRPLRYTQYVPLRLVASQLDVNHESLFWAVVENFQAIVDDGKDMKVVIMRLDLYELNVTKSVH